MKARLFDFLRRADAWMCDPKHRWRSWGGHAGAVLLFGHGLGFGFGPVLFAYFFREAEQAKDKRQRGEPQDVTDNLMDVIAPLVAVAAASVLFGWR